MAHPSHPPTPTDIDYVETTSLLETIIDVITLTMAGALFVLGIFVVVSLWRLNNEHQGGA